MRILAVTNMYPTPQHPASGTFVERQVTGLREAGVDVEVFLVDRQSRGPWVYFGLGRALNEYLAKHPCDLIHVMYGGVMAQRATSLRIRPTVVSFCGSDLLGDACNGLLGKWRGALGVRASLKAARFADGIAVKSRNLLDALPVAVRTKTRIIPNGVDLSLFCETDRGESRRRLGLPERPFLVLFQGKSGDRVYRFELAQASVRRLTELGVEAELVRLENVSHRDVPSWLNACDVLLITSEHAGSPNIVKEALACNVPVVAVDVGDVRERITGVEGCFISLPNAESLAANLRRVWEGPRRVKGRHAVEGLSLACASRRLREFYEKILADRGERTSADDIPRVL